MFKEIKVVDLSKDDETAARDLYESFTTSGFAYVINHGVSQELTEALERVTHEFFALPEEIKMKCAKKHFRPENVNSFQGYFPVQLNADSWKEGFEIGDETTIENYKPVYKRDLVYYEKNAWPTSDNPAWDAEFKETMTQYYTEQSKLGSRLMRLLAIAFNLPEEYFDRHFHQHISSLRLNHYPYNDSVNKSTLSCLEHVDSVALTLLHQDSFGGLQVQNPEGEWIDAPFIPDSYVINVGKTLEKWSGMKLKATMHRVLGCKGNRYSIPLFYTPNPNVLIEPFHGNTDGVPFEPFTYGEFGYKVFMQYAEYQGQLGLLADNEKIGESPL